jgi:gluconokinase
MPARSPLSRVVINTVACRRCCNVFAMTDVVIGLDLGTTSVKALALSAGGAVIARSVRSYALHSGADGSAVQDAEQVVQAAFAALSELADNPKAQSIRAIVPSAAMHTLVLLDAAGRVLAPALTWADTRPASTLPDLCLHLDPAQTYTRTGCPLQAPYHPARLWWLRHTQPELFERAARFVSLADLLVHRLTGQWATSVGLASTTGLWNLHTRAWDEDFLAALGIRLEQLPAVLDAREQVGIVQAGPLFGVPVLAGSSDGACANLGCGASPGEVVLTVGTSGAVRRLSDTPMLDPQARTWSYRLDLATHLGGGAINNGGLLLDWVQRQWYSELSSEAGFDRLLADAAVTPAGADGVSLLPYLTGERSPLWRSDLSASLHGLKLHHTRAHIARASLEAIAFTLAEVWELGLQGEVVYSTGGLARNAAWNGLLADVLGVPVIQNEAAAASAIGAALLGHGEGAMERMRERVARGVRILPGTDSAALKLARTRWQALSPN